MKDHLSSHFCWETMAAENPEGFEILRDLIFAPGKRVRPLLFAAACRDFGVEPFPRFSDVALALELAHSFILIHDDLIDRSAERRGRPTLQCAADKWFSRVPADGFQGADFALVGGDLLFSLAIESLSQADVPAAAVAALMQDFMTTAQQTARGAFLEMQASQTPIDELTTEQVEEIYALKTGCYTFTLPLKLAAVCTDSDPAGLEEIGRPAGIAFQLQNDLNSLQRWQETG
ncbi:MAG TPA: polyprenyl synthetase family protein, partial [Tichowtungia sp.]|nr:polyprenyl synthetase family protein [Tichowtungia sp.]